MGRFHTATKAPHGAAARVRRDGKPPGTAPVDEPLPCVDEPFGRFTLLRNREGIGRQPPRKLTLSVRPFPLSPKALPADLGCFTDRVQFAAEP